MAGYLGQLGQPGMRGQDAASGFGLLARDVTALEENDRGWENLPPWGYKRNRPQDIAPPASLAGWLEMSKRAAGTQGEWLELPKGAKLPRGPQSGHPRVLVQSRGSVSGLGSCCTGCAGGHGCVSGLGDSNAAVSANAMEAANAYAEAILETGVFGTSLDGLRLPDFARANALFGKVDAGDAAGQAVIGYANSGGNAVRNLVDYGNDEGAADEYVATAQAAVAGLKSIAAGQAVQQVAGDSWTDSTKSGAVKEYVHKDDESLTWLQSIAGSGVGEGVITAGAFTAGVTGINRDAILDEAAGSDIDVGRLVEAGEAARESALSMGKYAIYIGAAVLAYLGAKKAGVI